MPTLAKYKIDLEMTTAKFKRQLTSVNSGLRTVGREALAVGKVMGAILPAAGVAGMAALTKQALEGQAALYDMSQRLGVTTEGLSRLQYAAEQSGVSAETLNMGLQRMTRRVSEAANGSGEAVKALDELGVSADKLTKIAPEEQFKVLADAIMAVEDPASRVRLAMKLFDSEGVSLIQTMQGGSKAIEEMGKEADRLGVTIDRNSAAAAKRATDAFTRLSASITGIANTLGSQFAPEIEAAANWLSVQIPRAATAAAEAIRNLKGAIEFAAESFASFVGGPAIDDIVRTEERIASLRREIAFYEESGHGASRGVQALRDQLVRLEAQRVVQNELGIEQRNTQAQVNENVRQYTVETNNATYALQNFASTAVAANDAMEKEFQGVIDSLKTQEEKILESFQRRREIIRANTEEESALRLDLMQRLNEQILPEIESQARQRAEAFYAGIADKEGKNPLTDVASAWESALGQMSSATSQFAGEQSGIYKALFAIEKGAAIARSIIAIQTGIAQAAAAPYPANLAAMAQVAGATASIISTISSTQFGGARASGGNVDAGKSYWVGERGPELFMPQSSGTVVPNNQAMQAPQVNVRLVNIEGSDGYENWASSSGGEQVFINHLQRNKRLIRSLVA